MNLRLLIAFLWLGCMGYSYAQERSKPTQQWPLRIALMDESISLPNTWFLQFEFNPAVTIGTEYLLRQRNGHEWLLAGNLGFYYHPQWQSTAFLNAEFGYRYRLGRWHASARVGAGYAHNFTPAPIYGETENGFEQIRDWGSPAFMPMLSFNVGYQLGRSNRSPEVYLQMSQSLEFPFSLTSLTHQFVGLGVQFYPFLSPNS